LDAPIEEQHALLELQHHDSAVDRLNARRGSLPEDARLADLAAGLAAVDQLAAERRGSLATLQRDQVRLEDEIDMVTRKARNEEERAASGKVTSPKELTAIQEEVASLKRRQVALEDDLLERMEQRETLEAELAELDALAGDTCQGCRVSISPVELAAVRKLPSETIKRCENCRRILVVE
jgi:predicted  nucleic acid-binding Zn-ribbon protein